MYILNSIKEDAGDMIERFFEACRFPCQVVFYIMSTKTFWTVASVVGFIALVRMLVGGFSGPV